jgi:uncharacterized membrane protein (TIGR02234 family)
VTERPADPRRRTFLPVTLVGIASAVLCAVAGHQPWAKGTGGETAGFSSLSSAAESGRVPAATALSLVLLACWGVLFVTRGRSRRVVAALGVLAALGVVATVVVGVHAAPSGVRDAYHELGVDDLHVARTAWLWVAAAAALVATAAAVAAARLVAAWPEMGGKYDAPVVGSGDQVSVGEDQDDTDVWKALNEGRDPTA